MSPQVDYFFSKRHNFFINGPLTPNFKHIIVRTCIQVTKYEDTHPNGSEAIYKYKWGGNLIKMPSFEFRCQVWSWDAWFWSKMLHCWVKMPHSEKRYFIKMCLLISKTGILNQNRATYYPYSRRPLRITWIGRGGRGLTGPPDKNSKKYTS